MALVPPNSALAKMFLLSKRFSGEARTQILLWYMLLLLGFILVALPLIRQRIFSRVDARVREDLVEEVEDFQALLEGELTEVDRTTIMRLEQSSDAKFTLNPQTSTEVENLFEVYFARRVPEDDTFLIGIVNQELYKSSPKALPTIIAEGSPLMQQWQRLAEPLQGEINTSESTGSSILYIAEPIQFSGQTIGVLLVAHLTKGERQEALEALTGVVEVLALVGVLGLLAAWWMAGRVLSPLRELAKTAHQISESDLAARISAKGRGEIADLSRTFNDMMDRLEGAFAIQRDFINDAGHELRTPITIIQGSLEVMGDDPVDRQETLALVMDELERMGRLVDDLVLLAKSERPDFLRLALVDTALFTEELLAKAKVLSDRTWQLDAIAKGTVTLDRQRVTEAMMNLVQNAVQHTQVGSVIAIGSAIDRSDLRLWVRDTGEGINLDDHTRIFERFARAAKTIRKSDGSGLGLAIVRAIAEAHHGKIALRSQIGQGSTFTLILPLQPLHSSLEERK